MRYFVFVILFASYAYSAEGLRPDCYVIGDPVRVPSLYGEVRLSGASALKEGGEGLYKRIFVRYNHRRRAEDELFFVNVWKALASGFADKSATAVVAHMKDNNIPFLKTAKGSEYKVPGNVINNLMNIKKAYDDNRLTIVEREKIDNLLQRHGLGGRSPQHAPSSRAQPSVDSQIFTNNLVPNSINSPIGLPYTYTKNPMDSQSGMRRTVPIAYASSIPANMLPPISSILGRLGIHISSSAGAPVAMSHSGYQLPSHYSADYYLAGGLYCHPRIMTNTPVTLRPIRKKVSCRNIVKRAQTRRIK